MKRLKLTIIIICLFSWVEMTAQEIYKPLTGSFKHFVPFGENYVGISCKLLFIMDSKVHHFQCFNKEGVVLWDFEIEPFNYNNNVISNPDSEFIYFINTSYEKTAMAESVSKEIFMTYYRISKDGKFDTFDIPYSDIVELKKYGRDAVVENMFVTSKGLGAVVSTKSDGKYFLVTSNLDGKNSIEELDFSFDETQWAELKQSKLVYSQKGDTVAFIQLSKKSEEGLELKVLTKDFNTDSDFTVAQGFLDYGTSVYETVSGEPLFDRIDIVNTEYARHYTKADVSITQHTLGSLFHFALVGDEMYVFGQGEDAQGKFYASVSPYDDFTIEKMKKVKHDQKKWLYAIDQGKLQIVSRPIKGKKIGSHSINGKIVTQFPVKASDMRADFSYALVEAVMNKKIEWSMTFMKMGNLVVALGNGKGKEVYVLELSLE